MYGCFPFFEYCSKNNRVFSAPEDADISVTGQTTATISLNLDTNPSVSPVDTWVVSYTVSGGGPSTTSSVTVTVSL